MSSDPHLSVIDLTASAESIAASLGRACRQTGFFYVARTGIDPELVRRLEACSREFFALSIQAKMDVAMDHGGRAWRGYFPVGAELTSGVPDAKEGIYFGAELPESDPRVASGTPLHGRNLFPEAVPELRTVVLEYMDQLSHLGHRLMQGLSMSLELPPSYFKEHFTSDPLVLFRIFNYPSLTDDAAARWSVGEHTDYGLLTILLQDECGGLEVKTSSGWVEAPPIPGTFVCNLGDMLERMTGGLYRSTPHRVRNVSGRDRLSFPFFFDPGWNQTIAPIEPGRVVTDDGSERWDAESVHSFEGTYGDYLLQKVSRVFPALRDEVL